MIKKIINLENLVKTYKNIVALNNLNLEVNKGELFGLVGPDGAGKTTLIRMLCGIMPQTSGRLEVFGQNFEINPKEIKSRIGYLSQKFTLYGDLSIEENIDYFARIHDMGDFNRHKEELLEMTMLTDFKHRLADRLSGGMKQKLALSCALIHKPEILYLDEPTTGVDPVSRRDFWRILFNLLSEGLTIIVSTPYMDEAERCSRVAMMNQGVLLECNTPENLSNNIGYNIFELHVKDVRKAFALLKDAFKDVDIQMIGDSLNIPINDNTLKERVKNVLEHNSFTILNERLRKPSLENVFLTLINRDNNA